jgi:hypothetical protein
MDIPDYKNLERRVLTMEHRLSAMFAVMVKEFPKYFAGETVLGIATNGEILADEALPDIHPIDLRSDAEKERGEAFRLTDMVAMEDMEA